MTDEVFQSGMDKKSTVYNTLKDMVKNPKSITWSHQSLIQPDQSDSFCL